MKFEEVLPLLKEGKKIRRKGWAKSNLFIYLRETNIMEKWSDNVERPRRFYHSDILADDWEVV